MKYRSRIDIFAAMLRSCKEPSLMTRIMYNSYMSYDQLKQYMPLLTKSDLVSIKDEYYSLTDKGIKFLTMVDELKNMMEEKNSVYASSEDRSIGL